MPTSAARLDQALRLGPRARVVQHATLRTATPDEQAPLRFALEDALATADFGDCGRLVVVRRLQLAALPRHAGPQRLARALELAWRAATSRALPATHPQAADAPAVYFASAFEARHQWLRLRARQRPATAWFWRAALPELGRASPAPADADTADTVAMAWWREAPEPARQALLHWSHPELAALAGVLTPAVLAAWQRHWVATDLAPAPQTPSDPVSWPAAPDDTPALQAAAQRVAAAQPASPEAATWLAAVWLTEALGRPPTAAQVQRTQALALPWAAKAPALSVASAPQDPATPTVPQAGARPALAALPPSQAPAEAQAKRAATFAPARVPPAAAQPAPTTQAPSQHTTARPAQEPTPARPHAPRRTPHRGLPWLADAHPSGHAGLLLVLNLLQALRFDAWLQQQPAAQRMPLAQALMANVLDHCGAPPHDPQRAWLALGPADQQALAGTGTPAPALRLWRLRLRRALRRHAGLDLPAMVQRPGWVSASATHLDVVYALEDADLRLRRLGLDADPGWVPWFGRIVAFHFLPRGQLPTAGDETAHG